MVTLSTLITKQHYIADAIGGIVLALGAYVIFIRKYSGDLIPEIERRVAPLMALLITLGVAAFGVAYRVNGR